MKKNFYLLGCLTFLWATQPAFAQTEKGTVLLSGNATASANLSTIKTPFQTTRSFSTRSGSPWFGKALTKRFLLSFDVGIEQSQGVDKRDLTQPIASQIRYSRTSSSLNFSPSLRFYLTQKADKNWFLALTPRVFTYVQGINTRSNTSNNRTTDADFRLTSATLTVGRNRRLIDNVYWENSASYQYVDGGAHVLNWSLNLQNLFAPGALKENTAPQYFSAGKIIFAGSAAANYVTNGAGDVFSLGIFAQYLKLLDAHWAVGGGASAAYLVPTGGTYQAAASLSPTVRYYIPIRKRLFFYPELALPASITAGRSFVFDFNYVPSVGMQYFLTPNVAMTYSMNLRHRSSKQGDVSNTESSSQINFGFSYILDDWK